MVLTGITNLHVNMDIPALDLDMNIHILVLEHDNRHHCREEESLHML